MKTAAKALLAALFAVCVYRAITQSVVFDEALTWELYIAGPLDKIFHTFDANHHFLNTILMRLVTAIFGVSALTLRIPALAGAVLYFAAVYRVSLLAFGEGIRFVLAVAALTLNPFVLDFMVVARGYGMALALWMWALAVLLPLFQGRAPRRRDLIESGSAIALSVTANLIFLLPAGALAGVTLLRLLKQQPAPEPTKKAKRRESKSGAPDWILFSAPIATIAVLFFLLAPVEDMKLEQFYTGVPTIAESLRSLASVSVKHSGTLARASWADGWRDAVAFVIAPLAIAAGLILGVLRRDWLLIIASGTAVVSAIGLILIHLALGRPYPADRTGLYFLPLATLALMGLTAAREKIVSVAAFAIAALMIGQYLTEFNAKKFWVWDYDADTRSMGEYLEAHHAGRTVSVGGSWQLSESLGFYLFQNHWDWLEINRRPPQPGDDYYALIPQDASTVQTLGLKEVFRGPVSGSVLAVPAK